VTRPAHDWDDAYRHEQAPPWDIGRPQPAFQSLADAGLLAGSLLDAGCGTGEHSLLAAAHGATVLGVDLSPTAIASAQDKAKQRGLDARFETGDLLTFPLPEGRFDTIIDCGVFHSFDDEGRRRYVAALGKAMRPGGTCYLMCFSEHQPGDWGPRRVTQAELRAAFADGWTVERIDAAAFDINPVDDAEEALAWLAVVRRT
jgi:cyclopropane fatty-acyl-phospholipid synthase-like methyltransferase